LERKYSGGLRYRSAGSEGKCGGPRKKWQKNSSGVENPGEPGFFLLLEVLLTQQE